MTLRLPPALSGHRLVVIDIEGNGQQPPEIVEIAVLPLSTETPVTAADVRTWLVRPTRPITPLVTRKVHGITDADAATSPTWAEVTGEVTRAIDGRVAVAHHAGVEHRVLGAHLPGWAPPLMLDTLRLAKAVWPGLAGGYGLDNLVTHAHLAPLQDGQRHRAGYDVWLTAALLVALIEHGNLDWHALTAAAARPGTGNPDARGTEQRGGLW